ncbi:hypothetical protein JJ685_15830 [Ramlibacter monticola]|uniref:Lipoprotein n=1 Tax=Ramlibacter monticola TaxID=1926872 RepID=A0A936Z2F6_9BURK|nr:hypothetical protein [Ramlibacter monticola]MBL0392609.1 hypothetical protein [Ramlibacter monticola]
MDKLLAAIFVALALAACSSTGSTSRMGNNTSNPAETKNSSDANRSGNPAAVSPGGGGGGGSAGGAGSGSGAR